MAEQEGNPRVVALALIEHEGRFLLLDHQDSTPRYFRPPGGQVKFAELAADSAAREIREESGAKIEILDRLGTLEDVFHKHGKTEHEVIFLFRARFRDPRSNQREDLRFSEPDGSSRRAVWLSPEQLTEPGRLVLPHGLGELLHQPGR